MKGVIIAAVVFVIFIALVEWRRQNASQALPRSYNTKVSAAGARRDRPDRSRRPGEGSRSLVTQGSSKDSRETAGAAADGGPAPEEHAGAPADAAADRRKAEAALDAIQRLMDEEARDDAWASAIEAWVTAELRSGAGSRLERIACKRTLCSLEATHSDAPTGERWIAEFPAASRGLRMMTLPSVLASGKLHTRSYLLKDGRAAASRD